MRLIRIVALVVAVSVPVGCAGGATASDEPAPTTTADITTTMTPEEKYIFYLQTVDIGAPSFLDRVTEEDLRNWGQTLCMNASDGYGLDALEGQIIQNMIQLGPGVLPGDEVAAKEFVWAANTTYCPAVGPWAGQPGPFAS